MFLQLLVLNDASAYDFLDKDSAAIVALSDIPMFKTEYDSVPEASEDILTGELLN